jgi:hypothetical protein
MLRAGYIRRNLGVSRHRVQLAALLDRIATPHAIGETRLRKRHPDERSDIRTSQ